MKNDSEVKVATLSIVQPRTWTPPRHRSIFIVHLKFNLTGQREPIQCMNFVKYMCQQIYCPPCESSTLTNIGKVVNHRYRVEYTLVVCKFFPCSHPLNYHSTKPTGWCVWINAWASGSWAWAPQQFYHSRQRIWSEQKNIENSNPTTAETTLHLIRNGTIIAWQFLQKF